MCRGCRRVSARDDQRSLSLVKAWTPPAFERPGGLRGPRRRRMDGRALHRDKPDGVASQRWAWWGRREWPYAMRAFEEPTTSDTVVLRRPELLRPSTRRAVVGGVLAGAF